MERQYLDEAAPAFERLKGLGALLSKKAAKARREEQLNVIEDGVDEIRELLAHIQQACEMTRDAEDWDDEDDEAA